MSIGGDLRWRYEYAANPRYGLERQDRWGVLPLRGSAFADLRVGKHWRSFAQFARSHTEGRAAGPSSVDESRLDSTNLYVEWQSASDGAGKPGMRVGVQEMQFGSGRTIDAREGPNVRPSFEAVHASAISGPWRGRCAKFHQPQCAVPVLKQLTATSTATYGETYSRKTGMLPLALRRSPAFSKSPRSRSILASPRAKESAEV